MQPRPDAPASGAPAIGAAAALAFSAALGALAWRAQLGGPDPRMMQEWGAAIALADGAAGPGDLLTSGAPAGRLLALLAEAATPGRALPAPALGSALVAALLAALWLWDMLSSGRGRGFALAATGLLILHPLLWRALADGPGPMLLILGVWMFGRGLFALRDQATTPAVMTAASGLLLVVLADRMGPVLALAAIPFVAAAAPPALVRRSASGLLLSVYFPALFALPALSFAAWLFTDSWTAPGGGLSAGGGGSAPEARQLAYLAIACALAAPVIIGAALRARGRLPILAPTLALAGSVLTAAFLASLFGLPGGPASLLAPLVAVAALSARMWPDGGRVKRPVLGLLAMGAAGGLIVAGPGDPRPAAPDVLQGEMAAGAYLAGRSDVLIDAGRWPGLIAARGSARGLTAPGADAFALAAMTRMPTSRYLAAPSPERAAGRPDAVQRAFPDLYSDGAPGYRLAHDQSGWRIYRRTDAAGED